MQPLDLTLLPRTAKVRADGVSIGGVDLADLAREFGTPAFVYDVSHVRENFAAAVGLFGDGVAYATKAFLCRALARIAYEDGMSLDVATLGEYQVARAAGVPARKLVVHGNNKSVAEVELALTEGVQWIVLDSLRDVALVTATAERLGVVAPVLLRANPGIDVHTHRFIATGNRASKFGLPMWTGAAEQAAARAKASRRLDFLGVHTHIGSLVFDVGNFVAAVESMFEFVQDLDPEVFVIGGGLGVRYLNTDAAPTFQEWGRSIIAHCRDAGVRSRVLAEPGRAMIAAAAVTVYRVGTVETKGEHTYVAVDGGMSDNPRPLLYDSGYEAFLPRDPLAPRDMTMTLVGRHCESGDTLVRDGFLPSSVAEGDLVATPVTGAYGYSLASNYNMTPRPPVVFVRDGEARLAIRRESLDDLLARDLG